MKKLLSFLMLIPLLLGFVPVQAQSVTARIPVEVVNGGVIRIEGERNLPDVTEITNRGEFLLTFSDSIPGDVYEYIITQVAGENLSMVYDNTVYRCRIYILDLNGTLTASTVISVDGSDEKPDEAIFINGSIKPVLVNPPIKKTVSGSGAPSADFEFVFKAVSNTAGYARQAMPMPEGSKNGEKTTVIHGGREFEFGKIEITVPGVYVYSIEEIIGNHEGFTYDSSIYTISFTITEENDALHVEKTEIMRGSEKANSIEFVNNYKPTPTPTPTPTHTPIPTPTTRPTPSSTPTASPTSSPSPSATPTPTTSPFKSFAVNTGELGKNPWFYVGISMAGICVIGAVLYHKKKNK